ncbi:cystathionine-beta-synthase [Naegleria gruberi]|uniref:Cystathionine-beta-synthase n=1 Tax=Naegleria gruberi TaxID=5762 RepID=D2VQZ4_NAEGR|nr:cystathionine-beta-synthase [Naegleria gruberi]EFC40798.1 cystathionine-beta-synthase [Naegleria gruberi]|eukprot:XP_002673542.1 cystathionine-beta-synthase [Naegleria gruberi strain NEG-M]
MSSGIVSAPVMKGKECIGLVDILDILAYLVELFGEAETRQGNDIFSRLKTASKFQDQQIGGITDFAHNPFTPIRDDKSLYDACTLLVKEKSHRCPVIDSHGKMVSILTQAQIVNFLALHQKQMGDIAHQKVGAADLGVSPVITLEKHNRTIDCFKKMQQMKVSGLAVVDATGILIGNLSARDIKAINPSNLYHSLHQGVHTFVQHIREQSYNESHPAISCSEETELGFVIGRLAANRIHRMYVCDKQLHPVKVISLRDIIAYVMANEN